MCQLVALLLNPALNLFMLNERIFDARTCILTYRQARTLQSYNNQERLFLDGI